MGRGNVLDFNNQRYGDTIYHRGSQWDVLHAGTAGQFLKTQGINKPPLWATVPVSGLGVCYDAIVDPSGVYGTHTTIQAALNAVQNINNANVLIFAGTYSENLVPPNGSSTRINLEGCPGDWGHQWDTNRLPSIGVNVTATGSNRALDLNTQTATQFNIRGIKFTGGTAIDAIRFPSDAWLKLEDCQAISIDSGSPGILFSGRNTGGGTFEMLRTYVAGTATTQNAMINNSSTTPALMYFRESTVFGTVNFLQNAAAATVFAKDCRFDTNSTNGLQCSSLFAEDCVFNCRALEDGIQVTKRVGVDAFAIIVGCQLNMTSGVSTSNAINLFGAGLEGVVTGNLIYTSGGQKWDVGVKVGAGVNCKVFANDYPGATVSVTGTPGAIDPLESAVTVAPHNVFSTTHGDTTGAAAPVDGDTIIGNATPKWSKLAISVPAVNVRNTLGVDNGETRPSWKTTLDATNPTTIGVSDAAAPGTSLVYSHRDHKHGSPATFTATAHNLLSTTHGDTAAAAPVRGDLVVGNSTPAWSKLALSAPAANQLNVVGTANADVDPAYKLLLDGTAPSTQAFGDAAAAGTSLKASHVDHKHGLPAAATHAILSATHTDSVAAGVVRGDLMVGNSTPAWARLAKGTAGQVIRANATDAVWAAPRNEDLTTLYRFRAHLSADQGVTSGSVQTIIYNVADFDDNSNFATGTGIWTVPVTGKYDVVAMCSWFLTAAPAATLLVLLIEVSGTERSRAQTSVQALTSSPTTLVCTDQLSLTAADTVKVRVFQNSGANQAIQATGATTFNLFAAHISST